MFNFGSSKLQMVGTERRRTCKLAPNRHIYSRCTRERDKNERGQQEVVCLRPCGRLGAPPLPKACPRSHTRPKLSFFISVLIYRKDIPIAPYVVKNTFKWLRYHPRPRCGAIIDARLGLPRIHHRWTSPVGAVSPTRGGVVHVFPGRRDTVSGLPRVDNSKWLTRGATLGRFRLSFSMFFVARAKKGSKVCVTTRNTSLRGSNASKTT